MEIPVVHKCPIAKATEGLIEIEPAIIAKLAGAVWEKDEWLVILLGTRSRKGLHVVVDGIYIPPNQIRGVSDCEVNKLPDEIKPYLVGALHSHHKMGAKFSGEFGGNYGDRGKDGLNVNYPMSIVISSNYYVNNDEAMLLGFDYEAEMTFEGPCGALMTCEAFIIPRGVADWPFPYQVEIPLTEGAHDDLQDCQEWSKSTDSTVYQLKRVAKCGLTETKLHTRESVFGVDFDSIVRCLPKVYSPPPAKKEKGKDTVVITGYEESYQDYKDACSKDGWEPYDEFMTEYNSERQRR